MHNRTNLTACIAALIFGTAVAAHAQGQAQPETDFFAAISAGGQFQDREFNQTTTFTLFDEQGSVNANQTLGSGFLFDLTAGYRLRPRIYVAVGYSFANGSGEGESVASIPNPLFRGHPDIKNFSASDYGDLNQATHSVNFMVVWTYPLTTKINLAFFGGPSVVYVKQDFASVSTESATAAIDQVSKTTGKAGNGGVDLTYTLNNRYGVGGFVRYNGGKADFDAVDLTFGGVQVGGGIRYRF
jgi:hypothetical protein